MAKEFEEDMSPLREGAVQLHELYEEFKNAGFSRKEAMELTVRMMGQAFGQAMNSDND